MADTAGLPRHRFEALDALRGLAAVVVLLHHLQPGLPGFLAVDLFFVLSGFVLSYRYFDPARERLSMADFAVARLARLYPLHLATLFAVVFMYVLTDSTPEYPDGVVSTFVLHLLLVQNVFPSHPNMAWNAVSWSISAELWVNLFVYAWLARARGFVIVSLCLASYVALMARLGFLSSIYDMVLIPLSGGMLRCFGSFLLGMLVWRVYRFGARLPWLREPKLPLRAAMSALELATFLATGYVLMNTPVRLRSEFNAPLVFAALILIFAFEAGLLSRLMQLLRLHWLGTLSYSIYLNHFWMLLWYRQMEWPAYGISWHTAAVYILPVMLVSLLTWLLIEKPFQKAAIGIWKELKANAETSPEAA